MVMKDRVVEIAPGVKYNVRAFDGAYGALAPSSTCARAKRSRSR